MNAISPSADIPDGFVRRTRTSPLTDPWEPIYSKKIDDTIIIGLRLATPHTNSRGLVHGGLISTLADNAMGSNCGTRIGEAGHGLVTISLNVDFLSSAGIGQWLEVTTNFVKLGGSICFAQCLVTADGEPCARASATFKVVKAKPG
jgi:uncharacterized protein (TIGR00369 family)